jgi:flagellar basal-body rod protein FlgB
MPDHVSFRRIFHALRSAISIAKQRHNCITSNINNVSTSDYKPKDIDFDTAMARALESDQGIALSRTHPRHIGAGVAPEHRVEPFEQRGEWNGYNWVNIDREMVKLMENNLMHRAAVETLLKKISMLKEVIREAGR